MSDQFKQLSIFETTVLHNQFGKTDAINASLKKSILKHEKTCAGMGRSNARLTWHSKYDMKDWCGDAYKDLINMFNDLRTRPCATLAAPTTPLPTKRPWTACSTGRVRT